MSIILTNNFFFYLYHNEYKYFFTTFNTSMDVKNYENSTFIDCDYYVVFNRLPCKEINTNGKLILIVWEPPNLRVYPTNYLKQFDIIISNFKLLDVNPSNYIFPSCLDLDFTKRLTNKKQKTLCVFNTKKFHPINTLLRSLLFYTLEKNNMIDWYGIDTTLGTINNGEVQSQYKYRLVVENYTDTYYFSEKLTDALLAESLVFYYGASHIDETLIHPQALIHIDLYDFDKTIKIISAAIKNNEYEKRLEFIQVSKKNILNNTIFHTLEKLPRNTNKFRKKLLNDRHFVGGRLFRKLQLNICNLYTVHSESP